MDSLTSKFTRSVELSVRKSSFNQMQEIWAEQMPAITTIAPNVLVGWSNGYNTDHHRSPLMAVEEICACTGARCSQDTCGNYIRMN
jgi:hypothetical protein